MNLKTFKIGGIHPEENKLSSSLAIINSVLPEQVSIPLGQHLGAPSTVLVKKGDEVKVGTPIGEANGFISANMHSSVSGVVQKIDRITDSSGYKRDVVVIKVDGDTWADGIDTTDTLITEITKNKAEIIESIKQNGIVGLGGATFPTFVKFMTPPNKTVSTLIINAVECEPYLTCDHRIMLEKAHEIMVGCQISMKALGVDKTIIGIENNKKDAIAHLEEISKNYEGIVIQPLDVKYPQGGEKQLINAVLGVDVPSGKIPIEVESVVINVSTVVAIYEAVQKNKPLIDRVVTVTGKKVSIAVNLRARIGTPIRELIEQAGGLPENTKKVINGGPMMGKSLTTTDAPMTKGTSGILLMDSSESKRKPESNCIRCARCTVVCPMGLEPFLLSKLAHNDFYEEALNEHVMDCMECGSCVFECPANKPLLDYIRIGKAEAAKILRSRTN